MGKLRVYCSKTLNKLSIYPLGNTPSAPSVIDICVPCAIAVRHGLCICLNLSQILLHLGLLSLQTISLESTTLQSNYWNEEWRLTQVLSPASKPQSLPTSTAKYLIDWVDPFQGLSTTLASIMPQRNSVHIIASLGPCSEPRSDSRMQSITNAWCQSWSSSVAPATQWWYQLLCIIAKSTHYKDNCQICQPKSGQDLTCWLDG